MLGAALVLGETESEAEQTSRSYLVRHLRQFLKSSNRLATVALLRALGFKRDRGWNDRELTNEVARVTNTIAEQLGSVRQCGLGGNAVGPRPGGEPMTVELILWTSMLLIWTCRTQLAFPAADGAASGRWLGAFGGLCHAYRKRLDHMAQDPLSGDWSDLEATFRCLVANASADPDRSEAKVALLGSLQRLLRNSEGPSWQLNVERLLARMEVAPPAPSQTVPAGDAPDVTAFSEVVGQASAVDRLRVRFEKKDHSRPLILSGPEGSGKRTLARAYAKLLFCEAENDGAQTLTCCGSCASCLNFNGGSGFGYIELNAAHADFLTHARRYVRELKYFSFSKHRVVILANAELAGTSLDAFLKVFEDRAAETTFIVLTNALKSLRASALSRADVCKIVPLSRQVAESLIKKWAPTMSKSEAFVDLIAMGGQYNPGSIWRLCGKIEKWRPQTLLQAKALLGMDWGESAIAHWRALLGLPEPAPAELQLPPNLEPNEAVRRVRSVLLHCRGSNAVQAISEPAFLGLQNGLASVSSLVKKRAIAGGAFEWERWEQLARLWSTDSVVDRESFYERGLATREMLSEVSAD